MPIGFVVNPLGNTVVVSATMLGVSETLYFDQALTQGATSHSIAEPTIFYVASPGSYAISEKIGGNEYATNSGLPILIPLNSSKFPTVSPRTPVDNTVVDSFDTRTGIVTLELTDVTGTGLSYLDVGADVEGAGAAAAAASVPNNAHVGFFGTTPVAKQTVAGTLSAVIDPNAKAVLTSILAALADYGLVVNGTT